MPFARTGTGRIVPRLDTRATSLSLKPFSLGLPVWESACPQFDSAPGHLDAVLSLGV